MAINGKRFERMRTKVQQIVRDEMKQADFLMQGYIMEHLHGEEYRPGIRASIKSKRLYGGENETDKLYSQTGTLLNAISNPNKKGYLFDVKVTGTIVSVFKGVKVSDVPYARIHEFGGNTGRGGATNLRARPYLNVGIKEFIAEEMQDIINKIVTRIFATQ